MKLSQFFCPQHHWLEPPQRQPGEGPHTSGLQMTDHHPMQHLTQVHTPLVTSKPKVRSCDVWNQDQELQYHKTAHQCVPGFFSLLTNFHFQLNWSCSFVKWPSYWWVCHCLGLHSSLFFIFLNRTYKQSFESPTGFSHIWPTRPIRLLFTDIHCLLLTQLQSSNFLPQFTTWATEMVNLSLANRLEHSLFLSWNMAQKGVGMTVFKPNACPQSNSSNYVHN